MAQLMVGVVTGQLRASRSAEKGQFVFSEEVYIIIDDPAVTKSRILRLSVKAQKCFVHGAGVDFFDPLQCFHSFTPGFDYKSPL